MARVRWIGLVLLVALGVAAPAGAQDPCPDDEPLGYVCGLDDPEDLVRIPGAPYVLTTGMGDSDSQRGGLYAVHVRTRAAREVMPDFSGRPAPRFEDCPGPPDPELFSAHGLALGTPRAAPRRTGAALYVVNHGGRESIEVFRLVASRSRVAIRWTGCVPMPGGLAANSVAPLPDGGVVATVPLLSESELPDAGLGRPTGDVLRWSRTGGWRSVPGAGISFPNGLLVAPDGRRLLVAGYTEQAVVELPLAGGTQEPRRVEVPFNPDNLRWSPQGEVLVAGQDEEPAVVQLTCIESERETCPIPTGVARLDPASFAATPLYAYPGDERFGLGTAAIVVGPELWIGSARAKRLLRVPLDELAAEQAPGTRTGLPALRLARRCVAGGRLRVTVAGDLAQVEEVRFGAGGRDRRAPFARVLGRRAARRPVGAVVTVLRGDRTRVLLRAGSRRCGS
jgi:hypothetical protein